MLDNHELKSLLVSGYQIDVVRLVFIFVSYDLKLKHARIISIHVQTNLICEVIFQVFYSYQNSVSHDQNDEIKHPFN